MQELNVLILEDIPDDAELLLYELRRTGFAASARRVETEADYAGSLDSRIDLILADYNLPQMDALRALHLLQDSGLDIPFIVVTGTATEQTVVECMKEGASDYLLKDRLARLGSAVTHALQEKQLRDEKRAADEALRRYAVELEHRVHERTRELQHAKDYAEAILNSTSDSIVLTDADGRIEGVNPAFERLFGCALGAIVGQSLLSLAVPEDAAALVEALQLARAANAPRRTEIRACRRDGTEFNADVAIGPMRRENGSGAMVCSIWDISIHKRVEDNLRQALEHEKELSDLKSRFTSMVSHELRTPLAVIQSSSDLLKLFNERMSLEQRAGQIKKIQSQVERLTDLLNDILIIGRAQSVGMEFKPLPMDLRAFCLDLVNEARQTGTTHRILFDAEGEEFQVNADVKLLHQAVSNLVSNAVKYSPPETTIFIRLRRDEDSMSIQVQDQGAGIAEEDQQHLFEVFYRAKSALTKQGTGLGLPIVKQSIEAHGGSVEFETRIGVGTTFTLKMPLVKLGVPLSS